MVDKNVKIYASPKKLRPILLVANIPQPHAI
jgi:hypothetical protein